MKKALTLLIMFCVSQLNANWEIVYQYGSMPCIINVTIYDTNGNVLFSYNPAPPPYPPITCFNSNSPAYAIFSSPGISSFRVDVDSVKTVSLPCLGGVNQTFTFSRTTPGSMCDTVYFLNY